MEYRLGMICREICERGSPQELGISWAQIYVRCSLARRAEGVYELRYKLQTVLTIDGKRFGNIGTKEILTKEEIERVCEAITVVNGIEEMSRSYDI